MWKLRMLLKWLNERGVWIREWVRALILRYKWEKLQATFPRNVDGKILLHIGCGEIDSPGFVNIDARQYPHVHLVTEEITDLSVFPDESVDFVYMCHIVEHLSRADLPRVLDEMRRVLKTGGVLRLSVPDFDRIIEIYQANDRSIESITQPLMGGQDYAYNFHYSVFNRQYLAGLLDNSGFSSIQEWDPHNCQFHDFDDWASRKVSYNHLEFDISLNIQGIK